MAHAPSSPPATPDAELTAAPHRSLVELSARFSHDFLRWLDADRASGLTYPRLRLLELLHCQGPAMMRSLADGLDLSARNLTALADSLEQEGLLRRVPHPTDRRATLLELTDEGMAAAEATLVPRMDQLSQLFERLTPRDRQQLGRILGDLIEAMAEPDAPGC